MALPSSCVRPLVVFVSWLVAIVRATPLPLLLALGPDCNALFRGCKLATHCSGFAFSFVGATLGMFFFRSVEVKIYFTLEICRFGLDRFDDRPECPVGEGGGSH